MQMWELVAREHVRDTLARYNWSGDAGRLDDLADTFCADGDTWRIKHRKVSTDWAAPNSAMARASH
jgi:hypothetical protein